MCHSYSEVWESDGKPTLTDRLGLLALAANWFALFKVDGNSQRPFGLAVALLPLLHRLLHWGIIVSEEGYGNNKFWSRGYR